MKALILYVGFVIASTAGAILVGAFVERQISPQISTILTLTIFFGGLIVSWIITVFVMDGSLKNLHAEKEQIEAEAKGREYMNRSSGKA
jgi:CDP-diglyceride synthetase